MQYEKPRDDLPAIIKWARVLLTMRFVPLGISTLRDPEAWLPLVGDINTAVHEFGHMLFMALRHPGPWRDDGHPRRLAVAVRFPLIFVGYFLFSKKNRDPHAR